MWLIQTKDKSAHTQIMFKLVKFDMEVYLKETLRFQAQTNILFLLIQFVSVWLMHTLDEN